MARLGLGPSWKCTFANDICDKKAKAYRSFFGKSPELKVGDVAKLGTADLPGVPEMVWASFPCQDLSLAGNGAGLRGERSGTFRPFWRLIKALADEGRAPRLVVLENVVGTLTSHSGADFIYIVRMFAETGYRVGALIVNALHFVPQSRPRLFVIGVPDGGCLPNSLITAGPSGLWHTKSLVRVHERLPDNLARKWVWWSLPVPSDHVAKLDSIIEDHPTGTDWHSRNETLRLLRLMNRTHRKKVTQAIRLRYRQVGTVYKRTRPGPDGRKHQRAEVRFDGISGCLRTPVGGSSRQTIIVSGNGRVKSRLLSPREAARLMGVPDSYPLSPNYNDAYHVFGDGVVVPVVKWLDDHLLSPLMLAGCFQRVA